MAFQYWNRYSDFLINGEQTVVPWVPLAQKPTDKAYIYKVAKSRLDKVSQEYYNSPYFGWLILQANPQFGGLEKATFSGQTGISSGALARDRAGAY